MLQIYVSAHCRACATARRRLAQLQARRPDIPARLVDVDVPDVPVPPQVVGTPIYIWAGRVLFRGNPTARELIERVTVLHEGDGEGGGVRRPG